MLCIKFHVANYKKNKADRGSNLVLTALVRHRGCMCIFFFFRGKSSLKDYVLSFSLEVS